MFSTSGVNRVGHTTVGPNSQGQDEGKASPYGLYGYPTHQGGPGTSYNQQDCATAAAGMYPVDPAIAWHAAAYNNLYRYELAPDWSGHTHHNPQMGFPTPDHTHGGPQHQQDPSNICLSQPNPPQSGGEGSSTRETPSPPVLADFKPNLAFSAGNGLKRDEESANQSSAVNGSQNNAFSDSISSSGSPNQQGSNFMGSGGSSHCSPLAAIASIGSSGQSGNRTPSGQNTAATRPQPVRSPYEWMKRPTYQSKPATKEGRTRTKDKYRVVYSDHQRLELEKEFHYSRYITIRRKSELAQGLNLSERQVKIWFQNRRAKERKHMKKRDELIQKEKIDVAASLHAHHAASQMAAAAFQMPPMLHTHPGVMSAAAVASSAAALSHL